MADVYLLHFDQPYWGKARHYVGYTVRGWETRVAEHQAGKGSLVVAYALRHGCQFQVVRVWHRVDKQEARKLEKKFKAGKNLPQLCPICRPT